MAKDDDSIESGASVQRSPRYPSMSLADAVRKVQAIYAADKTAGSPMLAALRHIGYKGASGPAQKAIGALRRFGLIDVRSKRVYPTNRAITIVRLPVDDDRRKKALVEAALSPEIYKELYDRYRESGLPSPESLEHELALGGQFNHNSIRGFVKDFLDSLKFAGLTNEEGILSGDGDDADGVRRDRLDDGRNLDGIGTHTHRGKDVAAVAPQNAPNTVVRDFSIPLLDGGIAVIKIPFPMSKSDFDQLTGTLAAWRQVLVRPDPPQRERVSARARAEANHPDDDHYIDPEDPT